MILTHNNQKVYNDIITNFIKTDKGSDEVEKIAEKFVAPRYATDIKIYINSINKSDDFLNSKRSIKLNDISSEGIGFNTVIPLNENFFYEVSIEIFGKNKIESVIKVVRVNKNSDGTYDCGAMFCGLTNRDRDLINTYGIFHSEVEKKKNEVCTNTRN